MDDDAFKPCLKCEEVLPYARFSKNRARKDGLCTWCKSCTSKYRSDPEHRSKKMKEWHEKNAEKVRLYARNRNRELRMQVLAAYSGGSPRCRCCGESEIKFLALDHINGKGKEHRREIGMNIYNWARSQGYPPILQVLCHNCNLAKGFYGICPHAESDVSA